MKKNIFLLAVLLGTFVCAGAQSSNFEGEITSDVNSVQKMKSQVLSNNILVKMILKKVMKKVENSGFYTGDYTTKVITKDNKTLTYLPYNNSYMLVEKIDGKMKMTTYYPYIKKGYYEVTDMSENQKKLEEMRKGTVEKTGRTMEILGRQCEIYKLKYEVTTDSAGGKSTTIMNNEFAMSNDPTLPDADQEYIPGVKGVPLKFINNTVSQMSVEKMLNTDFLMYIATEVKEIKPRKVEDAELAVPADIKLIDKSKDEKGFAKIIADNQKYLVKNGLWNPKSPDDVKIYDNLEEDWDY